MSNVEGVVNQIVANQGVMYVKLHQFHWYVQGPEFFKLHEKFEELYDETTEKFDVFAERLIALGAKPYSTLAEFLEHATIQEKPYEEKMTAEEMVREIITDFETLKKLTERGVPLAGEAEDYVTEDLLIGYIEDIDLTLWMLRAYLGEAIE